MNKRGIAYKIMKDYMYVFDNLFFNIEKNKDIKSIIEQANEVFAEIITKYGEIENEISLSISKQDDFVDTVVCLFIRKIMEQLDAINVLFSVSLLDQSKVILRTLIENIVSLEFILKEDTEKRAAAYFLEHHYKEIELGKKCFNKNSKYAKQIIEQKGEKQFENDCNKYRKKVEAFERLVKSKEVFRIVDRERKNKLISKTKSKKNRKHIQWYEVCSEVSSFRGLMKEAGYEKYYEGIYGILSYETHALNSTMDIIVKDSGFYLKFIRNPEDGGSTFYLACCFSMSALNKIYQYLNDGVEEKAEFKNFYIWFTNKRDATCENLERIKIDI